MDDKIRETRTIIKIKTNSRKPLGMFLYLNFGGSRGSTGMEDIRIVRDDGIFSYFLVCSDGMYRINFVSSASSIGPLGLELFVLTSKVN